MDHRDCNKINLPLALSSSSPSWWDFHHLATCPTPFTSSWNNTAVSPLILSENLYKFNSSSTCDQLEDVSITGSNHSSLTVDESFSQLVEPSSSSNKIITERTDFSSNLWSQLLSGVESHQKMQASEIRDEVGENLLNAPLKSFTCGMFEPSARSDYLENIESNGHNKWVEDNRDQYPNSNANHNIYHNYPVNISSIAPPPMVHHLAPHPCHDISSIDQHNQHPDNHCSDQTKHKLAYQRHSMEPSAGNSGLNFYSNLFNHSGTSSYLREESDHQAGPSLGPLFPRDSSMHNLHGFIPSVIDTFNQSRTRLVNKPAALTKSLSLLETKKQHENVRDEGKNKKRSNDDTTQSSSSLKRLKHDTSSSKLSSTAKVRDTQAPKVKIAAEKISALQQIVSPYGKTDTASVLQEAIGFIKCHQEQVQLLSNPYLKSSVNKLQEAWRSMDRTFEKGVKTNKVLDLKSKGLCLVPSSSIPHQVYKDSAGPEYWPAYRGCMYR